MPNTKVDMLCITLQLNYHVNLVLDRSLGRIKIIYCYSPYQDRKDMGLSSHKTLVDLSYHLIPN